MKNKPFKKTHFLCFVLLAFVGGCDSAGDGTSVSVPRTEIRCSTAKCAGVGFADVVISFTLSGCAGDQITFEEYSTGSMSLTCNGTSCTGTISSWSPNTIPSRTYYVCGWIDIDNDGIRDASDAFSEEQTYITGSPLTITNWGATYSSVRQHPEND